MFPEDFFNKKRKKCRKKKLLERRNIFFVFSMSNNRAPLHLLHLALHTHTHTHTLKSCPSSIINNTKHMQEERKAMKSTSSMVVVRSGGTGINLLVCVILLCTLFLINVPASQGVDSASSTVFANYEAAFGASKVTSSFASSSSLDKCHEATEAGTLDYTTSPPQVGCASYINGDTIATMLRGLKGRDGAIMRPYLVSELDDKMCFVISKTNPLPADIVNMFDFLYAVPPAVKVHDSIFEAISPKGIEGVGVLDSDFLLLSALMNATLADTQSSLQLGIVDEIYNAATELKNYDFSSYNTFFWTSPAQEPYFDSGTVILDIQQSADKKRFDSWRALSAHLEDIVSSPTTSQVAEGETAEGGGKDPCLFASIAFEKRIDGLVVPLKTIKTLAEPLRSSCLTYLTSYFAEKSKVFNLALFKRPKLLNYRARSIMQSNAVGSALSFMPYTQAGLKGDGQIVSVADTGLDVNSCYFYDQKGRVTPTVLTKPFTDKSFRKVIQYSFGPSGAGDSKDLSEGHGTHVSGIIVGNIANSDITKGNAIYAGVAPNAKLVFVDISTDGESVSPPSVNQLYYPGYSAGARVHTNSWGSGYADASTYGAAAIDNYLFNHQDFTILFAAGNEGMDGVRTVGLEAQAKNVVAVGSSETTFNDPNQSVDNVAYYSSHGPAYDMRYKPDIVSTGDALVSAKASGGNAQQSCNTVDKSGTSMASPAAAGTALLIRQFFVDSSQAFWTRTCRFSYALCKSFQPSGVLVKAALLHSGHLQTLFHGGGSDDVTLSSLPDHFQGFGRPLLPNLLPMLTLFKFDLYVDDLRTINPNSAISYNLNVISSSRPVKATLSWYDPPAVDGTSTNSLLHNLNLLVTSPSGRKYYGNGGKSKSSFDTINNNEQVAVDNPETGSWVVTVSSKSLPVTGSQKYAIIITSLGMITNG